MIFVSYSHADEKWRQEFEIMLKPMSRDLDLKRSESLEIGRNDHETQSHRS
jgi:hypothetical protein